MVFPSPHSRNTWIFFSLSPVLTLGPKVLLDKIPWDNCSPTFKSQNWDMSFSSFLFASQKWWLDFSIVMNSVIQDTVCTFKIIGVYSRKIQFQITFCTNSFLTTSTTKIWLLVILKSCKTYPRLSSMCNCSLIVCLSYWTLSLLKAVNVH